jgi:alpha-galactosidase
MASENNEVIAAPVDHPISLDAAHPAADWDRATPITFSNDWQGKNADLQQQTTVRVLWSPDTLYLRFECRYRDIFVFDDSDPNGRRDQLWDRDVAEVFLGADLANTMYYKEFEISPNGMWIDLDIFPGGRGDLKSGLQKSVILNNKNKLWAAELAIPMRSITPNFDPHSVWRVNFYRVEGKGDERRYRAWRPTNTPRPNFHVPEAFGVLRFAPKP